MYCSEGMYNNVCIYIYTYINRDRHKKKRGKLVQLKPSTANPVLGWQACTCNPQKKSLATQSQDLGFGSHASLRFNYLRR